MSAQPEIGENHYSTVEGGNMTDAIEPCKEV